MIIGMCDIDALRYAVELQPAPRARIWKLTAVMADLGDAIYVADAHASHDGERARVRDTEEPNSPTIYDTGTRTRTRRSTR